MADLKNTIISDVGSINLPSGTTAQRPTNPPEGSVRYNTDLGYSELYVNRAWSIFPDGKGAYLPRNDLVLELSYDDPASWPGTGTTWFDTSGNSHNFRLASSAPDTGEQAMNFSTDALNAKYKTDSTDVPGLADNVTYVCVTRVLNSTSQWRTLTRSWVADHHVIIESGGWNIGMYDNDSVGFLSTGYSQQRLPKYPDGYQVMIWRWGTANTGQQPTYVLNVDGAAAGLWTASFNNSNGQYNRGFSIIGGYHNGSNDPTVASQPWGWIKYFAAYNRRLDDIEVQMLSTSLRTRYRI